MAAAAAATAAAAVTLTSLGSGIDSTEESDVALFCRVRPRFSLRFSFEEYDSVGQLILPDKSLLEEYVKRKRGRLEQFLSEPIPERDEPRCDSPTNSVTSELFPACAVRVFGRSPHGVPVITAPSRSVSRVSSVASVVEPTTPTVMLDTLTNYNNFNSTPQAFLRDTSSRIQIAKPIQFDAPKTPFEERIQQQAHANRKASLLAADDRAAMLARQGYMTQSYWTGFEPEIVVASRPGPPAYYKSALKYRNKT
ncbi:unnamed protein product [Heligmosomoides polygyrus]|uniref:Uncharacterized protein n=1 Tax=Heligmosomoides polygyrus TaxID=6339 RepID=A0A183FRV5_HELPZ|nr:unnamed protein product [Heligmosomoides polygyrus]